MVTLFEKFKEIDMLSNDIQQQLNEAKEKDIVRDFYEYSKKILKMPHADVSELSEGDY